MIEPSAGIISAGEPHPMPNDELDTHEMTAIDIDKLEELGHVLSARRDEWVQARRASGVERRWLEDLDQYHGRDASTKQAASMMEAAEQGYPVLNRGGKAQRSTVYVNITRPKTNAAEARLANMLFPSDDRNWGLKPSPSPELTKAARQAAQQATQSSQPPSPLTAAQATLAQTAGQAPTPQSQAQPQASAPTTPSSSSASDLLGEATQRCKAMQDEIDDQLLDCQYNGEGRKVIHDCAVLGTGVLKGPIVVTSTRKAWEPVSGSPDPSVYQLEIVQETKPASESVSPWNVFPDPSCGGDVHNGRGIFEYRMVTSKQLRELAKQPGYLEDQIGLVLEQGPDSTPYISADDQRHKNEGDIGPAERDQFQLWEYWGEFTSEDLRATGVDMPDTSVETLSGCIVFVNQTVIKGFLNPIETGDLPYDFIQWELVDGSPWGYGVPSLMRPSQKVLNAAWRQLMDNSGLSAGPQILLKKRGIVPADGQWELTGRKVWLLDDTVSAADAMATHDIPNYGQQFQQIIDMAMKFADQEASIPAITQGEKDAAPDTVGGITILMNSANVVLSRMVKQFDDSITRPHLRRYYDWNMAYNEKAAIKGDFQVDARGSSALLVRDLQAQALLQLGQYQGSAIISPFVNWEAWFKQVLKLQHIDPTDIMKTEEEIAQIQNQPPQASPEQVRAQAALQVAQIRAGAVQQVAQAKVQGELQYAQMMQVTEQQNHAAKQQEAQDALQLAMLQYAHQQKLSLQEVQGELAKTAMQEQTKRQLAAADLSLRQGEAVQDRQYQAQQAQTQAVIDAHEQAREHAHAARLAALNNSPQTGV